MPLPEGYTVRRADAGDAAEVAAVMTAADDVAEDVRAPDVEREWRSLDLEHDVWVVESPVGRVAAYLESLQRGEDRLAAEGYVHPEHTGRGLGGHLLELSEARGKELLDGSGRVTNAIIDSNRAATELFESRGYRSTRHFFRMAIDLEEEPPPAHWPEGLEPRPFDRAHAEAFHAANEDAFAEEFGHVPETFEEWRDRRLDAPRVDTSQWLGVWDADELAATLICDAKRFEMGWVGSVGVRTPWRRRGLGLALLNHAFGEFWQRGERRIGLGVDAENPTGAARLYERAGMRALFDAVLYEKELA
ncbi:MAG: GNAT family N-acetyltransferase [Actinomycetota bacterium]|nr:GNAT family N-acetyltransferase [Actinomycetota bacterium]